MREGDEKLKINNSGLKSLQSRPSRNTSENLTLISSHNHVLKQLAMVVLVNREIPPPHHPILQTRIPYSLVYCRGSKSTEGGYCSLVNIAPGIYKIHRDTIFTLTPALPLCRWLEHHSHPGVVTHWLSPTLHQCRPSHAPRTCHVPHPAPDWTDSLRYKFVGSH